MKPPRIAFVSLGCPKATVDSEHILTALRREGYRVDSQQADANLVIINTCGFIDAAIEESLAAIGEAMADNGRVIVTGCLGARAAIIQQKYPHVLAITGPHDAEGVLAAVHRHLPPPQPEGAEENVPPEGVRLAPPHYAWLKISEGCNHDCTFCIIPALRGALVSRPIHEVLKEAEQLVRAGVKELLVIAQDTSAYGVDLQYRTGFWQGRPLKTRIAELARELGRMGVWVRMHYVYPYPSVDALVELMAEGLILPYLDIPFQHADADILRAMRRPASSENVLARIARWREICPDITLRSTFITGFPGETESQFNRLLDFLDEARLDRVGAFAYSPVEGAAANALAEAVPEGVRESRRMRLMQHQEDISRERLARWLDREITVLVDDIDEDDGSVLARSSADAPDIDGQVIVPEAAELLRIGQFARVRVTDCDAHDLFAEPVLPA